jgi:hypothetical protein
MEFTWPPAWWGGTKDEASEEMSRAERVAQVVDETCEWFVNTHWIRGTLYTIDETGKKRFCAVGGFCQVLLDKQGLDRSPEFQPSRAQYQLAGSGFDWDLGILGDVFDAERELAITVDSAAVAGKEAFWSGSRSSDDPTSQKEVETHESIIVHWNDRSGVTSEGIVEKFRETSARIREHGLSKFPHKHEARYAA